MNHPIIENPSYTLSIALNQCSVGTHLQLISYMPDARRFEHQVKFDAVLTPQELQTLHDRLGDYLSSLCNS